MPETAYATRGDKFMCANCGVDDPGARLGRAHVAEGSECAECGAVVDAAGKWQPTGLDELARIVHGRR